MATYFFSNVSDAQKQVSNRPAEATVFVIDDDEPMRNALRRLISASGLAVEVYASAKEFMQRQPLTRPACILLDLNMPEMNGLELQEELHARGVIIPVIFLTGAGNVSSAVVAMRAGAIDFVEKPFCNEDLLERISKALDFDHTAVQRESDRALVMEKVDTLTAREKQVLVLLTQGQSNKLIARKLDMSPRTVEGHRARLGEKLNARSVAELVRIVQQCESILGFDLPANRDAIANTTESSATPSPHSAPGLKALRLPERGGTEQMALGDRVRSL